MLYSTHRGAYTQVVVSMLLCLVLLLMLYSLSTVAHTQVTVSLLSLMMAWPNAVLYLNLFLSLPLVLIACLIELLIEFAVCYIGVVVFLSFFIVIQ